MVNLSVFNGRGDVAEGESLEVPDELEAENLAHHTRRCALRYKLLRRQGIALNNKMNLVLLSVVGMTFVIVATSGPGAALFAKLWH